MYLGSDRVAAEMCQVRSHPDPIQRTMFIDRFPPWRGTVTGLLEVARTTTEPGLRSAICLALGGLQDLTNEEIAAWRPMLQEWYLTSPDGGTHSAADYALRKWKIPLPDLASMSGRNEQRDWFVNSIQTTMLEIKPGVVPLSANFSASADGLPRLTDESRAAMTRLIESKQSIGRGFFLSDREITARQYMEFLDDESYPLKEKPFILTAARSSNRDENDIPAREVSWYDAVLFCNWLSQKEGLSKCYRRTGSKEKSVTAQKIEVELDEWELIPDANGYRLPTEMEWEYACRAGTSTDFSCGNDRILLRNYAVIQTDHVMPVGDKMPNAWGLFDMHGNVWEWCEDLYREFAGADAEKADGPFGGLLRVYRGASWDSVPFDCRSARRGKNSPSFRHALRGIRIARSVSI
jgi:formylglycine-generating enzyme required for sulfatase activity